METTRLSSKGQIIIPQSIRDTHHWLPGLNFKVVELNGGILLQPIKTFESSQVKEVLGCTNYKGKRKTLKNMDEAIAKGTKRRDRD